MSTIMGVTRARQTYGYLYNRMYNASIGNSGPNWLFNNSNISSSPTEIALAHAIALPAGF